MSNASLINIGLSGIKAHQAALATTGQNITNASTPGYTRQRVNLEAQVSTGAGTGVQGVRIQGTERIYDAAAVNQLRTDTSVSAKFDQMSAQISQIDSLLADEASNLNRGFEAFFAAVHSAANSPSSLPARQLVLSEAEGLVSRFQSLDGRLREQLDAVKGQAAGEIDTINRLASSIADINGRLGPMSAGDGNTNALLDQRDELVRQLAEHVDLRTSADGKNLNVFVGNGQPLIVGNTTNELDMTSDGRVHILNPDGSTSTSVTLNGGSLGGLLAFRNQTLEPVINELGRLAVSFAGTVNQVHSQGLNLRGEYGGNLFSDLNAPAQTANRVRAANTEANLSSVAMAVEVSDPSALAATDYELSFLGAGGETYEIRSGEGTLVSRGRVGDRPVEISFDGLTLRLGEGEIRPGAEFSINAAEGGVASLSVAMHDPRDLALASPLSIATGESNQGTGQVSLSAVSDVSHPLFSGDDALVPPLLVRFTSNDTYEILDNTDPLNPQPLDPPVWGIPFVPGGEQALLPDQGQQLLVSDGQDSNALPAAAATSVDLAPVGNGFGAETVRILRDDAGLGTESQIGSVDIQPGMSARAIAAALNEVSGVTTAARTELKISGLQDNGIGEPLVVGVNGERLELDPGSDLGALADAINASSALQSAGIRATSDGDGLTLVSERGDDLSLHVAGDVSDGLQLEDVHGTQLALNGTGPGGSYETATVGGSVRLLLDEGLSVESDSALPGGGLFRAQPVALSGAFGFQAMVTGNPQAGDTFEIRFNDAGNLDNHNALALANLQVEPSLGDPPANFSETYSSIVEKVGIRTSQIRAEAQASEALLAQSVERRESISGVNLDEEAANLMKFEQGYNASSRVISVAREIFDILMGAVS